VKMNIGQVLLKAGTSLVRDIVPGAGAVIDLVNGFLPNDKKLPSDATGKQAIEAIDALPPKERAQILAKEVDVQIAEIESWTRIVEALSTADASGASTRPSIAKGMAQILALMLLAFTVAWVLAVVGNQVDTLKAISDSWEIFLVVLGYPMWVIKRYFGARETDKKTRASAALGQPPQPGGLAGLAALFRK